MGCPDGGKPLLDRYQLGELRNIAESLVESLAWDQLPWDDAWAGKYPERSAQQVDAELAVLTAKVERIIRTGQFEGEYSSMQEHLRMIHLEGCATIDLFGSREAME